MAGAAMSVTRHHAHSEQHRGFVPEDQLADGTPTAGYAVLATGTGEAEWGPVSGGGSGCDCCHEHTYERFVAAGGSPETLTLAHTPLYGVEVYVQGLAADPDDVTLTDLDVTVDTVAGDTVVIRYAVECGVIGAGGMIYEGDPSAGSGLGVVWYYVSTEAEFAALTPGPWTADTLYPPGSIIFENGHLFARGAFYNFTRRSHPTTEPVWTGATSEGDALEDDPTGPAGWPYGEWQRLPDSFDVTDPLPGWAASTAFAYLGFPVSSCYFIAEGGNVYCAWFNVDQTGTVKPVFPTDPCAGIDRVWVGGNSFTDPAPVSLSRPYVTGSVTATLNGTPMAGGDIDDTGADDAMVDLALATADPSDILVISYTAVCP